MKKKALAIIFYSIVLIFSSITTSFTRGPVANLVLYSRLAPVIAVTLGSFFIYFAVLMVRGKKIGYYVAVAILSCFSLFLAYRFVVTLVLAPLGAGFLASFTLLLYLLFSQDDPEPSK